VPFIKIQLIRLVTLILKPQGGGVCLKCKDMMGKKGVGI
jgi:hypothetical protein